jgi:hypothetical protein
MKLFKRFGVRASLLLAFVVISGFAVLATGAAIYSFQSVKTLFDKITEERVDGCHQGRGRYPSVLGISNRLNTRQV